MEPSIPTQRWLPWTAAIFAGVLAALTSASIHFSTLELRFGSTVAGSAELWRGHTACFEIKLPDPLHQRYLPLKSATFWWQQIPTMNDRSNGPLLRQELRPKPKSTQEPSSFPWPAAEDGLVCLDVPWAPTSSQKQPQTMQGFLEIEIQAKEGKDALRFPARMVSTPTHPLFAASAWTDLVGRANPNLPAEMQPIHREIRLYPLDGPVTSAVAQEAVGILAPHFWKPQSPCFSTSDMCPSAPFAMQSDAWPDGEILPQQGIFRVLIRPKAMQNHIAIDQKHLATPDAPYRPWQTVPWQSLGPPWSIAMQPSVFVSPNTTTTLILNGPKSLKPVVVDTGFGNAWTKRYRYPKLPSQGLRIPISVPNSSQPGWFWLAVHRGQNDPRQSRYLLRWLTPHASESNPTHPSIQNGFMEIFESMDQSRPTTPATSERSQALPWPRQHLAELLKQAPNIAASVQQSHHTQAQLAAMQAYLALHRPQKGPQTGPQTGLQQPLLANTTPLRQQKLAQHKNTIRSWLHRALVAHLSFGLIAVCIVLAWHQRRTRLALQKALPKEWNPQKTPNETDIATSPATRYGIPFPIVLAALSIALAGYAILMLLTRLRWR